MILNLQHSSSRALAILLLSKKKLLDCIELCELRGCFEPTLYNVVRIRIDFLKQEQNFSFIYANITLLLVDMIAKIKQLDEKYGNNEEWKAGSVASNDWLTKFMKRNNVSMQKRTTIEQEDPSPLMTKLVKYLMHVRRLSMKANFSPNCIMQWPKLPFGLTWLGM